MHARFHLAAVTVVAAILAVLLALTGSTASGQPPLRPMATAQLAPPPLASQPTPENSYVPITPCRIVDTRLGSGVYGTPLGSLQTRYFVVAGTLGFTSQGGKSGGCGIPKGAVAVTATLLVVSPSNAGRLHAWPNGVTEPTATTFYYQKATSSTGTTLSISPTLDLNLAVKGYFGPTDLVIDVSGYFVKPLAGIIGAGGAPSAGSSRITGSVRQSTGVYQVSFDRNVRSCATTVTAGSLPYIAEADPFAGFDVNTVRVRIFNADGDLRDQFFAVNVAC